MSLKLNSSGGGSVTLQEPSTANNQTLTLPDNTGTLVSTASTFAGTGPAFSATASGNTTITSAVSTLAAFNTENFDTNGCYNNTGSTVTLNGLSVPAYAFCPNVAGYYLITARADFNGTNMSYGQANIYKNGSLHTYGTLLSIAMGEAIGMVSRVIYFNGTSDYVQFYLYAQVTSGSVNVFQTNQYGSFDGCMVRSA